MSLTLPCKWCLLNPRNIDSRWGATHTLQQDAAGSSGLKVLIQDRYPGRKCCVELNLPLPRCYPTQAPGWWRSWTQVAGSWVHRSLRRTIKLTMLGTLRPILGDWDKQRSECCTLGEMTVVSSGEFITWFKTRVLCGSIISSLFLKWCNEILQRDKKGAYITQNICHVRYTLGHMQLSVQPREAATTWLPHLLAVRPHR